MVNRAELCAALLQTFCLMLDGITVIIVLLHSNLLTVKGSILNKLFTSYILFNLVCLIYPILLLTVIVPVYLVLC